MDSTAGISAPLETEADYDQRRDNDIRALRHKKPQINDADFTMHIMEDGTRLSTQERVCKGTNAKFDKPYSGSYSSLNIT